MLTEAEQREVAGRAREVERLTGAQVVVAVLQRARAYPEATWRAFSSGAALGAAAAVGLAFRAPRWPAASDALGTAILVLGVGVLAALLARFTPAAVRLLAPEAVRAQATRDRARALFLDEGVHRTRDRIGVLLLVCGLERRVELVADAGLEGRVPALSWEAVLAAMRPALAAGRAAEACAAGLGALERTLVSAGLAATGREGNELPRELVLAPEERS